MNSVGDIIINKQPIPDKKLNVPLIVFLIVVLLLGAGGAYYWYVSSQETPKDAFFRYLSQTNIPEITDTKIYYDLLERMKSSDYETNTTADFTTTKQTDFTANVDVSNFLFSLNTKSNKLNEETYLSANITYSANPFFDLEFIKTKDNFVFGSSEISDRYIVISKNNLIFDENYTEYDETEDENQAIVNALVDDYIGTAKKTVNSALDTSIVDKISSKKINLPDDYKSKKAKDYLAMIKERVPDSAITITENSPITINSTVINTKAYTLALDANAYKGISQTVLTKLSKDTEFLERIVTGVPDGNIIPPEPVEEEPKPVQPKPLTIESIGGETIEHQMPQEIETEEDEEEPENEEDFNEETEELPDDSIADVSLDMLNPPTTAMMDDMDSILEEAEEKPFGISLFEDKDEEDEEKDIINQIVTAIIFNQKLDMNINEIQYLLAQKTDNFDMANGLTITVYVQDEENKPKETKKIIADVSKKANLDIEYQEKSKAKITYLADKKVQGEFGEDIIKNQGTSIEIKRTNTDVENGFDITINTIEEQKVVGKLQIDLKTKGTETSRSFGNEMIIKNTDSEGDLKVNIKNTISFQTAKLEKEFNPNNSFFVDQLSEEEKNNLFGNIVMRLMSLYSDKILNMNFINMNGSDGDGRTIYFGQQNSDEELQPSQSITTRVPTQLPSAPDNIDEEQESNTLHVQDGENVANENEQEQNGTQVEEQEPTINTEPEPTPSTTVEGPVVDPAVTVETISREDIKNKLSTQINQLKTDANNNGQPLDLNNLRNLPAQIDGMNVSTIINTDNAIIKVAGYTFNIDKNFNITEE